MNESESQTWIPRARMRKLRAVALLLGCFFLAANGFAAHPFTIKKEWTQCKSDNDCVAVPYLWTCSWQCINHAFRKEADEYQSQSYSASTYICKEPEHWTQPSGICRDNQCSCESVIPLEKRSQPNLVTPSSAISKSAVVSQQHTNFKPFGAQEIQTDQPKQTVVTTYTLPLNLDFKERQKREAGIREFLWTHWFRQKPGELKQIAFSKEGDRSITWYQVKADEQGQWHVAATIHRTLGDRKNHKGTVREQNRFVAYRLQRIVADKDRAGPGHLLQDDENAPSDSYRLRLEDKNGTVLTNR